MRQIAPAALALVFLLPVVTHAQDAETIGTQCEWFNTTDYNADGSCFDAEPTPKVATLVPFTPEIPGRPEPLSMAVEVNTDGTVAAVLVITRSDNQIFTRAVIDFARSIEYNPARKDGQAVRGWTEQVFVAGPRQ